MEDYENTLIQMMQIYLLHLITLFTWYVGLEQSGIPRIQSDINPHAFGLSKEVLIKDDKPVNLTGRGTPSNHFLIWSCYSDGDDAHPIRYINT